MMERAGWASTKREGSHGKCDKGRASTFGVIAGLAGLEHVISEILQGSVVPNGIMFESWPNSEFLRILAVEISIEYTNGLSADDSLDGFDPGDLRRDTSLWIEQLRRRAPSAASIATTARIGEMVPAWNFTNHPVREIYGRLPRMSEISQNRNHFLAL